MAGREAALLERLREVTVALRDTRTELDALLLERGEPIAIVGIGCRFPGGAASPDLFWELLDSGRDAIQSLEPRWALVGARSLTAEDTPRWAGLLNEAVDGFDATFFGIAPREARSLDPQQRLLLEVAWEALEGAGLLPGSLAGSRTGVFIGACTSDYLQAVSDQPRDMQDAYGTTGTMLSIAAGRLSYTLGLEGPCLTVDTACSSSLVAVHLACRSLRARESDLALAGGVSLLLSPDTMESMARTQALSPEGRCRTFDALANGFVRGEGCGLVVLKRLSDARRDGDPIWALIRGSAINQDGRSTGLTTPNVLAQEGLLREALRSAGVDAAAIGYVETHGTGTSLGDPIEVEALRAVLGAERPDGTSCVLGAVKTNIGHLEGAAGVAGLIKATLSLHHERIPKNLNFRTLNPRIRLEGTALALAKDAVPWPATDRARFAGVSSFGLSGTNAHLILEEAPPPQPTPAAECAPTARAQLVVLSAKSESALSEQAARLAAHIAAHPTLGLGDLAFSLATTRTPMEHRLAVAVATREELLAALHGQTNLGGVARGVAAPRPRDRGKVAFLFTGQGAQVPGMGRGLAAAYPAFRDALDRAVARLGRDLDRPLRDVMWAAPGSTEAALLDRTAYAQPALFAVEYALAELWRSWGVTPDLLAGHSIGELTAACVAGVFSLEDAARLAAARGRLMDALPTGGAMVSIAATETEVASAIAPQAASVAIAAINGPRHVVISGAEAEVHAIAASFAERGVRTKPLRVSHAFHSPLIDPMLDAFARVAESIAYRRPSRSRSLVSAASGELATDDVMTPAYWVRHARNVVRFADAARALHEAGASTFVELGPKPVLLGLLPDCIPSPDAEMVLLPSLRCEGEREEDASVLASLGSLWSLGGSVDWAGVFSAGERACRVPLPTYAWQRERHWVQLGPPRATLADAVASLAPRERGGWPLSGARVSLPGAAIHHVLAVGVRHQPFLRDHVVFGEVVVPGAFHVSVILAIAHERWSGRTIELTATEFLRAIVLAPGQEVDLHVVLTPEAEGDGYQVDLATAAGSRWTVHARGRVRPTDAAAGSLPRPEVLADRAIQPIDEAALLERMSAARIDWGPLWRWSRDARVGEGVSTATLVSSDPSAEGVAPLHPILLDNGFGVALLGSLSNVDGTPPVPFAIERLRFWRVPNGPVRCGAVARSARVDLSDFVLVDDEGVVAEVEGLVCRRASRDAFLRADAGGAAGAFYELSWQEASLPDLPRAPPGAPEDGARWVLVAAEGSARAAALAARLTRAVVVEPARLGAVLEREPAASGLVCVVCLWEDGAEEPPPVTALRVATESLSVVQTLLRHATASGAPAPLRLWWVTSGAVAAHEGERVRVGTSPIWGMGRTVIQEHPELGCTLIDLGAPSDDDDDRDEALVRELSATDGESQIAWRGGRRAVARLVRLEPAARAEPTADFRGKTVLVTGGLGALGLHVARWLAMQPAIHVGLAPQPPADVRLRRSIHLLLTGRRGLSTPGATAAVAELEGLGARVTVAAVDVADRESLGALLHAVPSEWPLAGVVHAAGVLDDGVLAGQSSERFASVLSPKVIGAWNLHELTRGQALSMFVLFSSASGLLGAPGQSNYAAANTFLDALAALRHADGLAGQSVAWGAWSEVGLAAARDATKRPGLLRQGLGWISPTEGIALFAQALASANANVGVMSLDLDAIRRALGTSVPPIWRALLETPLTRAQPDVKRGWKTRLAALPAAQRGEEIRSAVRAEVARVLGWNAERAMPLDRPLSELGLDSLMAVEVRNALSERVGATLPATLAFDYPTVDAIAGWLEQSVLALVQPSDSAVTTAAPNAPAPADEPIAIVGLGCRFPGGVTDPESFWRLLDEGRDAITEVPPERWDIDAWYDADPEAAGKMTTRWGGFVPDIDRFDAGFLGISPREAVSIDPQARLLLETSWEALERAGLPPERLMGSDTAVFMGLCGNEYQTQATSDASAIDAYSFLGTAHSAIVGRLSYFLGLKGPNLAVDTACSSSLVAVHLGCQALRRGECRLALVGGANVVLSPEGTVYFSRLRAMSPTGRCHTFSAEADGYVRSEGCGVVVLKRLSEAQRDGDRVLAVIRGSAVNQDGRSNGLTAPNGPSQEAVIRQALAAGGIRPAEVDYVECHGTGTPLGDPIEVQALAAALGAGRAPERPVIVGSVKTNLGHTEAAAGVAGMIKAVLALEHGRIPKSLHFGKPNPHIPWSELNAVVAAEAVAWPRRDTPRRAGVSSFGFSGTNAHVVLEEAAAAQPRPSAPSRAAELVVLSAKSAEALAQQASRLREHLDAHPDLELGDVAFSLATTRSPMEHRLAVVATSREQLRAALAAAAEERGPARPARAERERVAFLFTGQGAQVPGMGRGLYDAWPAFREAFDRCRGLFDRELERPLAEIMWAAPGSEDAALLDQTGYTQPALFTLSYALVALWRSWGVTPELALGHSIGELTAACVAGVFSLEDAVHLVAARGRLMQALPAGGAMVSIAAPEAEVAAEIARHAPSVSIAAINGPELVVISGAAEAVLDVAASFATRGVRTKRLTVSHAFHSPLMDPMLDELTTVAKTVRYERPAMSLVSNLSGQVCADEVTTPEYWARHVREPVRFADGVKALHDAGATTFVEVGPKAVLLGMVPACLGEADVDLVPSLQNDRAESEAALAALGKWFVHGGASDWKGVFAEGARRVDLPTYPWQRERYWVDRAAAVRGPGALAGSAAGRWPLAGVRLRVPGDVLHHVVSISARHQPFLEDHVVFGKVVVPGAFHIAVILGVAADRWPDRAIELSGVEFLRVVPLEPGKEVELHAVLTPEGHEGPPDAYRFELSTWSATETRWTTHARGRVEASSRAPGAIPNPDRLVDRVPQSVEGTALFDRLSAMRVDWGPRWRWLRDGRFGPSASLATLVPTHPGAHELAPLHPCLLDNGFAVGLMGMLNDPEDSTPQLPFAIERLRWWSAPNGSVRCGGVPRPNDTGTTDFVLVDEDGSVVAEVEGFLCRRAPREAFLPEEPAESTGALYRLDWSEAPLPDARPRPTPDGGPDKWVVVATAGSAMAAELSSRLGDCASIEPAALEQALALPNAAASPELSLAVICLSEAGANEAPDVAALRIATDALTVVQALRRHRAAEGGPGEGGERAPVRLWWVTTNAVPAEASDLVEVAASTAWGLGRTVMQELPELGCTLVDVDGEAVDGVMRELGASDQEAQVAWRGGRRRVARLVRVPVEVAAAPARAVARRTQGTVLVTGGLGALGLRVARWLAQQGMAHLMLTGRRGTDTPGAAEAVRELEALGAEVTVVAVDVADRQALSAALASIPAEQPLSGVVHAAGVLDDGVLAEQDAERFARVLSPKVAGTWNLHALTTELTLDFFVLFSSMAGLLGAAGQSNYAAANSFLDAVAGHRRARGLAAQSIAWGPWSEGGMATRIGVAQQARLARQGVRALSPAQGIALLEEALRRPEPHLAGMRLDLPAMGRAFGGAVPSAWRALIRTPARTAEVTQQGAWAARVLALPPARRADEVRAAVEADVARVLSLGAASDVAVDRSFVELGLDSLMAVELRNALGRRVGVTLPATLAFDHPTPSALVKYLLDKVLLVGKPEGPTSDARHLSDAEIRMAIASISVAELRQTGLLGKILRLADRTSAIATQAVQTAVAPTNIDQMETEDLIRMFETNGSAGHAKGNGDE